MIRDEELVLDAAEGEKRKDKKKKSKSRKRDKERRSRERSEKKKGKDKSGKKKKNKKRDSSRSGSSRSKSNGRHPSDDDNARRQKSTFTVNRGFLKSVIMDNQKKNVRMDDEEVKKATEKLRTTFGVSEEAKLMTNVLNTDLVEKYHTNADRIGNNYSSRDGALPEKSDDLLDQVRYETDTRRAERLANEFKKQIVENVFNKYK